MIKATLAHLMSFVAEAAVALMSAMTMYGAVSAAGGALDVDHEVTTLLGITLVIPFAAFVLSLKTVFPRTPGHRSYRLWAYVSLSQLIAGLYLAVMLELVGECWDCRGNVHDIVFYAIILGTPYGLIYAFFSKMFSLDVDTPDRAV